MKQSLQLRIGQSLKMTPQLQQAIRLLQLSSLELQTEIQQTLDANPLLDQDDNLGEITVINYDGADEANQFTDTTQFSIDSLRLAENRSEQGLPDELPTRPAMLPRQMQTRVPTTATCSKTRRVSRIP